MDKRCSSDSQDHMPLLRSDDGLTAISTTHSLTKDLFRFSVGTDTCAKLLAVYCSSYWGDDLGYIPGGALELE